MTPKLPIAAITDEFSPNLSKAVPPIKEIGMTAVELRVVNGKNILDLTDQELHDVRDLLLRADLQVISIASPLLKCVLPGAPEVDSRFQHDVFASTHAFADQPRLTETAIRIARFFGARIVRVFSYWRSTEPEACLDAIVEALTGLARVAESENLIIGLENEHACNIATAAEVIRVLDRVPNPHLGIVWDPATAFVAGEDPFPHGYSLLPKHRIVHVHAKDCDMDCGQPNWGPLGTRHIRWKEQIQALLDDRYSGFLSLETHWRGPGGDKLEASRICGWNLKGLAAG